MNAQGRRLPPEFEPLESFVDVWSVAGADDRARLRRERSEADRMAFFEAAAGRVDDALTYLDKKPLSELSAEEERLMNLMLSFAHVALAVEILSEDEPGHAKLSKHLRITRASAEQNS